MVSMTGDRINMIFEYRGQIFNSIHYKNKCIYLQIKTYIPMIQKRFFLGVKCHVNF